MPADVIFVVGYALALLAGAVGLHRLGRTNRRQQPGHLRSGRTGARTDSTTTRETDPDWPHSEVPRFYSAMALVAIGASIVLPVGEFLGRDHRSPETALLIGLLMLAVLTLGWIGGHLDQGRRHQPGDDLEEGTPRRGHDG